MRGVSVKNPERSLAICLVASAMALWAVWTGAAEIASTGAAIAGVIVAIGGAIVAALAWVLDPFREKRFF